MHLKYWHFDLKLVNTWRIASGFGGAGGTTYAVVFVELRDDEGRVGIGESAPSSRYQENSKSVEAFLRKVDAKRLSFDDVGGSMRYLDEVGQGDDAAKCAVNLALR